MLKPIPQEITSGFQNKKRQKQKQKLKIQVSKLQLKIHEQMKSDEKFLETIGMKLMDYGKRAEAYTLAEIGELIHHLQRSILNLQRKRLRLMQKKKKKSA